MTAFTLHFCWFEGWRDFTVQLEIQHNMEIQTTFLLHLEGQQVGLSVLLHRASFFFFFLYWSVFITSFLFFGCSLQKNLFWFMTVGDSLTALKKKNSLKVLFNYSYNRVLHFNPKMSYSLFISFFKYEINSSPSQASFVRSHVQSDVEKIHHQLQQEQNQVTGGATAMIWKHLA